MIGTACTITVVAREIAVGEHCWAVGGRPRVTGSVRRWTRREDAEPVWTTSCWGSGSLSREEHFGPTWIEAGVGELPDRADVGAARGRPTPLRMVPPQVGRPGRDGAALGELVGKIKTS